MQRTSIYLPIIPLALLHSGIVKANDIKLVDWGFNIDSTRYCKNIVDEDCDFTGVDTLPETISVAGIDKSTGLGVVKIRVTGAGNHTLHAFFDHEITQNNNTFFNESGTAHNSPESGQIWEIDEPGFISGDIFKHFLSATYHNTNSAPQGSLADISMGQGWELLLNEGEQANVSFTLSQTKPEEGFYLTHSDSESAQTIYFSSQMTIQSIPSDTPTTPPPAPIPATSQWMMILLTGLLGLLGYRSLPRRHHTK